MRYLLLCCWSWVMLVAADDPTVRSWDFDLSLPGETVAVRVHAPANPTAPCPVLIFSHGLGGSREGYGFLTEPWAAAGFVVIQPNHAGSDTAMLKAAGLPGISTALTHAVADPAILAGRPRLISRLIDALPAIAPHLTGWHGTLDPSRIGVGGHSFGAWTTQVVAGIRFPLPGHPESLADPRPLAFLALSPNGPSKTQAADAWRAATKPILLMTGTEDAIPAFLKRPGDNRGPAWREEAFAALPPGAKHLAVLSGAHHCAFSNGQGARLTGEPLPAAWIPGTLVAITTTWWQATVAGDAGALARIAGGGAIPTAQRTLVRWEDG
jgi:dienelactone hydrolase